MEKNKIVFPVMESVKVSLGYVVKNFNDFIKLTMPIILALAIINVLFFMFVLSNVNPIIAKYSPSDILLAFVQMSFLVLWQRKIILKDEKPTIKDLRFWKREIKFLGSSILLMIGLVLSSVVITAVLGFVGKFLFGKEIALIISLSVGGIFLIYFSINFCRLNLFFSGICVDDKEMKIKKSWRMTKGNVLRILTAGIMVALPIILLSILQFILTLFLKSQMIYLPYVSSFIAYLIKYIIYFLAVAVNGSYLAHMYLYFKFYEDKKIETKEQEAIE